MVCNFLSKKKRHHQTHFHTKAIGDKIVETLYSNRVTSENKRIHTLPQLPPFKVRVVCCFLYVAQTAAWCNIGWGRKSYISPLLRSVKGKKAQFQVKCHNSFCRWLFIGCSAYDWLIIGLLCIITVIKWEKCQEWCNNKSWKHTKAYMMQQWKNK